MIAPALPSPAGVNPAKAKFFAEAASAFELMALFYQLTAPEQEELRDYVSGLAATVAARDLKKGNKTS